MTESKLQVAEMFYSIQGEGNHAGVPAVFLRLAGCNLQCGKTESNILEVEPQEDEPDGDATWICDTMDVWRTPDAAYTAEEMFNEFEARGWWESLIEGQGHLILTGGEPTLPQHQKAFAEFMEYTRDEFNANPFVEVETNGTQVLMDDFLSEVNQFNCSLKLSNSGHTQDERIDFEAQEQYEHMATSTYTPNVTWKFVVSSEEDLEEIDETIELLQIPNDNVTLMPAGQTREQLNKTYPKVADICMERGWKFTPRTHVNIWDQQTGV